jgi:hypothetical protein
VSAVPVTSKELSVVWEYYVHFVAYCSFALIVLTKIEAWLTKFWPAGKVTTVFVQVIDLISRFGSLNQERPKADLPKQ